MGLGENANGESAMIEDKFTFYKENVKKALVLYRDFAKRYFVGDFAKRGKQQTIERLAKPFADGYFTLAVMGNTSAGKSTFINALLGEVDLLPTDFRQTTCVLTEIVYGEKLDIEVTFGDGHTQHLYNAKELRNLVAIPEEYANYPVNTINDWIINQGFKKEAQFIRRKDFLDEISKASGGIVLEESKIREYVRTHTSSNIATKVVIKYPLPQIYKGWRIVDTPGVNAIGGIQNKTQDFINDKDFDGNNSVDAIIFLKSGKESISDAGFKDFVERTVKSLTEDAQKRLFMLLSFGASREFMKNKEYIMQTAKDLFKQFNINEKKVISIDNICELFLRKTVSQNLDIENLDYDSEHNGWDDNTWEICIDVLDDIKKTIKRMKLPVNNQQISQLLTHISGFESLHKELNEAIVKEKEEKYNHFIKLVLSDIKSLMKTKLNDKKMLEGDIEDGNTLKKELDNLAQSIEKKKKELNDACSKTRETYSRRNIMGKFSVISYKLNQMQYSSEQSDPAYVKAQANALIAETRDISIDLIKQIASDFDKMGVDTDIDLPSVDVDSIWTSAREGAKERVKSGQVKVGSGKDAYYRDTYTTKVNEDKFRREFFDHIQHQFSITLDENIEFFSNLVEEVGQKTIDMLNQSISEEKIRREGNLSKYQKYEDKMAQLKKLKSECDDIIDIAHKIETI